MWIAKGMLALWLFGLAGCASQDVVSLATVHAVLQKDAPVQIVSIKPSGDNELATVTIKNTTDRYVQTMGITWTAVVVAVTLKGVSQSRATTESFGLRKPDQQLRLTLSWSREAREIDSQLLESRQIGKVPLST
jgi:hypothetical protein